jgi:hypothetical protein
MNKDKDSGEFNVKFTPSKKLSARVNSNFEDLIRVKLKPDLILVKEIKPVFDQPDDFKDTEVAFYKHETIDINKEELEILNTAERKKLISDDLIRLHKEIVNEDESKTSKTNLWG